LVVFRGASSANDARIYIHSLESNSTRPVEGTYSVDSAFFSPDGQEIAFTSGGTLKTTPVGGGTPRVVCDAANLGGGEWGRDGTILLALQDGIWRVSEKTGEKRQLTTIDRTAGETGHRSPRFLADGKRFLYLITHQDASRHGIYVSSFGSPAQRTFLGTATGSVRYLPPVQGEASLLLFIRNQMLVAQRFDDSAARLVDQPVTLVGPIATATVESDDRFMVSAAGVLAFRIAEAAVARRLVWFNRDGSRPGGVVPQELSLTSFFLSPDDTRVSVDVRQANGLHDVQIFDFDSGVLSSQTSNPANDFLGVWSPNGRRLAFGSTRSGVSQIYLTTVGGGSDEELRTTGPTPKFPLQWSSDGRYVLFRNQTSLNGAFDLWAVPVDGDRKPFPVVTGPASKFTGQISPDGKWIAYQATAGDAPEIYVQSFPTTTFKVQVSRNGGRWPKWVDVGNKLELFYVSIDNDMTVVELAREGNELRPRTPRGLFRVALPSEATYPYAVTSDGKRLLVSETVSSPTRQIEILTNWRSLLVK
jgi:Tol biopolymer transport system component